MTIIETELSEAGADNYEAIKRLLQSVSLPLDGVKENLSNFLLLRQTGTLVGTVGLEIYGQKALLRSLAVLREHQSNGYGTLLYQEIVKKAKGQGINEIFILTETAETFFKKKGFQKVSRDLIAPEVKESIEFRSACPESAISMRLELI